MRVDHMPAQILDGRLLAQRLKTDLKEKVTDLRKKFGRAPRLVSILVSTDPSALSYINSQKKVAEDIGIDYEAISVKPTITEAEFIAQIKKKNQDSKIDGVIIQKPLPSALHYQKLVNELDTAKDVEGTNISNMGQMLLGKARLIPCTPAAVLEHIKSTGISIRGKEAVVVGRSEIVGKPIALLLLESHASVTVCHSGTPPEKLIEHLKRADIVIAAVGKANFIKGEWIKEGAIVIDVGINEVNGKILGDVEFEKAKEKASFITPVPGGVGPVTAVMLMRNSIEAFEIKQKSKV